MSEPLPGHSDIPESPADEQEQAVENEEAAIADTEAEPADNGGSYGAPTPAIEPDSHAAAVDLAEEAATDNDMPAVEGMPAPGLAPGTRLPVREYLDATVVPVLREGLRKLCKERCPLQWPLFPLVAWFVGMRDSTVSFVEDSQDSQHAHGGPCTRWATVAC